MLTALDINFNTALPYLRHIVETRTEYAAYYIHAWGGSSSHLDNLPHTHSFFEICYVVSGEGVYQDGASTYVLREGDLFCSRPHITHQIHQGAQLHLIWIGFELRVKHSSPEAIQLCQQLAVTDHYFLRDAHSMPAVLIWQAILIQASIGHGSIDVLQPLAAGFLSTLMGSFLRTEAPVEQVTDRPDRVLLQAKTFIIDNLTRPLQLEHVADYLHVSSRYLSRLFHDHDRHTFVTFLRAARVNLAAELLRQDRLSIKEIAAACGFDSVHYFTRVFQGEMGVPPGQYRKQARL
ncbi:helix-turn-helix domain-containing protein [Paenibacillus sp. GCM10023252]|uniref:helix-turn-helix domain-containing protein n=1 Tax=Paenibacillus sp. GCM10023252 TaxID=3252649 RepID=UPI0036086987